MRFPITLGFETGDTEIVTMDGDAAGNLYMAGITKATELIVTGAKQSVFIAKHDQTQFIWFKVINHVEIDQVQNLFLMGELSTDFLLYATSSISQHTKPYIYLVKKTDGIINRSFNFDQTDYIYSQMKAPSLRNFRYQILSARSPTEVYFSNAWEKGNQGGWYTLFFQDISLNNNIQHRSGYGVDSHYNIIFSAIIPHKTYQRYFYATYYDVFVGSESKKNFIYIASQDRASPNYWYQLIYQPGNTQSQFYAVNRMLSFGGNSGDKLLCVATNDDLTNMYKILLIYFIDAGTDVYPDYSNKCTQYWLGDLGKYVIKGVDSDPTNDKIIYIYVEDQNINGGTFKVFKIDFNTFKYIDTLLNMGNNPSLMVNSILRVSSVDANDFYFFGKAISLRDDQKTKSFSKYMGFVMKAITTNQDQSCFIFNSGYALSLQNTCSKSLQSVTEDFYSLGGGASTNSFGTSYQLISNQFNTVAYRSTLINSQQTWCTRTPNLQIIEGSLQKQIIYISGSPELKFYFNPNFTINQAGCNRVQFLYQVNSTSIKYKDNSINSGITTFPVIIKAVSTTGDYLSVYTTNYDDSSYIVNTYITVSTPDYRYNFTLSIVIYFNQLIRKESKLPSNPMVYVKKFTYNTTEDSFVDINNYFEGIDSNPYDSCRIVDQYGLYLPWIQGFSLNQIICNFQIEKLSINSSGQYYLQLYSSQKYIIPVNQTIDIQIISCGDANITLKDDFNEQLANGTITYDKIEGKKKIILEYQFNKSNEFVLPLSRFFYSNLEKYCPIVKFQIAKVIEKNSNNEILQEDWSPIFEISAITGFFQVINTSFIFENYQIFIDGINEYEIKNGSDQYLIDLSVIYGPSFLQKIQPIFVDVLIDQQIQNQQIFYLPQTTNDTLAIQIMNQFQYPYLNIEQQSLIVNTQLIKEENCGNHIIVLELINKKGWTNQFNLPINIKNVKVPTPQMLINNTISNNEKYEQEKIKELEKLKNLTGKVEDLSSNGDLLIRFNDTIKVDGINISELNSSNIHLKIIPANSRDKEEGFNASKLNFTWMVVELTPMYLKIKLNFLEPNWVSTLIDQDWLIINLTEVKNLIVSNNTNLTLHENSLVLDCNIPPQQTNSSSVNVLKKTAGFFQINYQVTIFAALLIGAFGMGNQVLLFIFTRSLSLIVHQQILKVRMTATISQLFSTLLPIVQFDFLDSFNKNTFNENTRFFDLDAQDSADYPLPDQAKDLGYDSINCILNLKTVILVIILYLARCFAVLIIKMWFSVASNKRKGNFCVKKYSRSLFFQEIIEIMLENLLCLFISSYLTVTQPLFTTFGEVLSVVLGYFNFIMSVLVLPLLMIAALVVNQRNLKKLNYQRKLGVLWEELKLQSLVTRSYYIWYWFRRVMFFLLSVILVKTKFQEVQVMLNCLFNLFSMIIIGQIKAFQNPFYNQMDIFNEFMTCIIGIQIMFLTEWVDDPDKQNFLQWLIIISIIFYLIINTVPIIFSTLHQLYLVYRHHQIRINNSLAEKWPDYFKKMTKQKTDQELQWEKDNPGQALQNKIVDNLVSRFKILHDQQDLNENFNYQGAKKFLMLRKRFRNPNQINSKLIEQPKNLIMKMNLSIIDEEFQNSSESQQTVVQVELKDLLKNQENQINQQANQFILIEENQVGNVSFSDPDQFKQGINIFKQLVASDQEKVNDQKEIKISNQVQNIQIDPQAQKILTQRQNYQQQARSAWANLQSKTQVSQPQTLKVFFPKAFNNQVAPKEQQRVNILDVAFEEEKQTKEQLGCPKNLIELQRHIHSMGQEYTKFIYFLQGNYKAFFIPDFKKESYQANFDELDMVKQLIQQIISGKDNRQQVLQKKSKIRKLGAKFQKICELRLNDFKNQEIQLTMIMELGKYYNTDAMFTK